MPDEVPSDNFVSFCSFILQRFAPKFTITKIGPYRKRRLFEALDFSKENFIHYDLNSYYQKKNLAIQELDSISLNSELKNSKKLFLLVEKNLDQTSLYSLSSMGDENSLMLIFTTKKSFESINIQELDSISLIASGYLNDALIDSETGAFFALTKKCGFSRSPDEIVKLLCVMATFNESDIIEKTVSHVGSLGFDSHIIDNWSNDGTWEILEEISISSNGRVRLERFPFYDKNVFELKSLLQRLQKIAYESNYEWILRLDADERILTPRGNLSIIDYISLANRWGFDAFDFTVLEMRPSKPPLSVTPPDLFRGYFIDFESHRRVHRLYRNRKVAEKFAFSGGHENLHSKQLFPFNFALQHFSIRSENQGRKKVFNERLSRYSKSERTQSWHRQYDLMRPSDTFIWDSTEMIQFGVESTSDYASEILTRTGRFPSVTPRQLSVTESLYKNSDFSFSASTKKVLLCVSNLCSGFPSGGAATYRKLINDNPDVFFISFKTYDYARIPELVFKNHLEILINTNNSAVGVLSQMFASVAGSQFDVIDIPDWISPVRKVRDDLKDFQIEFGKICVALHGSDSLISKTRPREFRSVLQEYSLKRRESSLRKSSDVGYGFSTEYAKLVGYDKPFIEIDTKAFLKDKLFPVEFEDALVDNFVPIFFGRKEFTKGFDLFLDELGNSPHFKKAKILATPSFLAKEADYMEILELRQIGKIQESTVGNYENLRRAYNAPESLFIFPSRFDSYNLACCEAVINGGVVVISKHVPARKFLTELNLRYLDFEEIKDWRSIKDKVKQIREHNFSILPKIRQEIAQADFAMKGIYDLS